MHKRLLCIQTFAHSVDSATCEALSALALESIVARETLGLTTTYYAVAMVDWRGCRVKVKQV